MFSLFHWRLTSPSESSKTPFPTKQLAILALCRLSEPIAFMSIFPYIYFMVKSFDIASDDKQIAIYAGLVTSSFALAEFFASMIWGRLSDKVGRKPILLTGLAGTGISMLGFGLAPNFFWAVFARALGGLLNGNIGVLHTTVGEVVTDRAHEPRAYTIMPLVWSMGSFIGYGLGGVLAEPVKNYPEWFSSDSLWAQYPFLLPNIFCFAIVIFGLIVGFLFLEETHEDKKERRDFGLELGNWLLRKIRGEKSQDGAHKAGYFEETLSFLAEDEQLPGYQSTEGTPRNSSSVELELRPTSPKKDDSFPEETSDSLPWYRAFSPQVMLIIIGYGVLAFHTIAFEQLFPVLLSMPESKEPLSSPFKFTGGFALASKQTGFILSTQAIMQLFVQVFVFPIISRRFGSLRTFRGIIMAYPVMYFTVPYLPHLPEKLQMPIIYLILLIKVTGQSLAFPSVNMMLNNSTPSKKVLGTVNGVAASSASLARAAGPTLAGLVQSAGLSGGYVGAAWWFAGAFAIIGLAESLWMKPQVTTAPSSAGTHDEEAVLIESTPGQTMTEVSPTSEVPRAESRGPLSADCKR